jgi:rubredoxin
VRCGFCGHVFDEHEGKKGCGGCPGGCHSVHCPRCNYKNPLEAGVVKKLKKIFGKNVQAPDKRDK